jgi:hypothetical protein
MSRTYNNYKTGMIRKRMYSSVDLDYGIESELGVDGTDRVAAEKTVKKNLADDPDYYQKIRRMENKFFRRKRRR